MSANAVDRLSALSADFSTYWPALPDPSLQAGRLHGLAMTASLKLLRGILSFPTALSTHRLVQDVVVAVQTHPCPTDLVSIHLAPPDSTVPASILRTAWSCRV